MKCPVMNSDLSEGVLKILASHDDPVKTFFLKKELNELCYCTDDFENTLRELLSSDKIKYTNLGLKCSKLDIISIIIISDEITKKYFSGQSIKKLSKEFDMPCDLVESHILSVVGNPEIDEDLVLDYQKYKMTQKQFVALYEVNKETFRYLQLRYVPGKTNLKEILEDSSKTISFRERFNSLIRKSVESNGKIVELTPYGILSHILEINGSPMVDADLLQKYGQFLVEKELENYEYLAIDKNNVRTIADKENGIVYVKSSVLVYCPYSKKELLVLFDKLNLSKYNGMYICTQLIVRHNKELLDYYGISSDYELYCLMFKYRAYLVKYKMNFIRVPSISFGDANICRQMDEILEEFGRIPIIEFYRVYEERYGMTGSSLRATYNKRYRKYIVDGKYYDYKIPKLVEEQLDILRPAFTNTWYFVFDAKLKFETKFGKRDGDYYFNAYNLDALGYYFTADAVYSKNYSSLKLCIEDVLDKADCFKLDFCIQDTKALQPILAECKHSLDIVPISHDEYITLSKLNEIGITKHNMMSYSSNFLETQNKGKCFTLKYMRNIGYEHELEDFGFEDIFYQALLEANPEIKCSTINNMPVYLYGSQYSKGSALSSIISYAMDDEDSMDEYELSQKIVELFGVDLENELRTNDLFYYNQKTMKVYRDKDCFYVELRR